MQLFRYFVLLILFLASLCYGLHSVRPFGTWRQTPTPLPYLPRTATCQMAMKYPVNIKNVITKLTSSTQKALQSRQSRIEIELPPGVDFGVEGDGKRASKKNTGDMDKIKTSNREAARLLTEMFSILGPTTVVLFPTETEASNARNIWGKQFKGQTLSLDVKPAKGYGNLRSRKFSAEEQEQALLASDGIYVPEETEVLIVAGPRTKDVRRIIKLHEKFGDGTLIILLNARLDTMIAQSPDGPAGDVADVFENVFSYAPPSVGAPDEINNDDGATTEERDILLYHEYTGKWYIAEKPSRKKSSDSKKGNGGGLLDSVGSIVGGLSTAGKDDSFKTLWEGDDKPSAAEIRQVLSSTAAASPPSSS